MKILLLLFIFTCNETRITCVCTSGVLQRCCWSQVRVGCNEAGCFQLALISFASERTALWKSNVLRIMSLIMRLCLGTIWWHSTACSGGTQRTVYILCMYHCQSIFLPEVLCDIIKEEMKAAVNCRNGKSLRTEHCARVDLW
jgi:hypothetical protein